jgi:hypothetical protein
MKAILGLLIVIVIVIVVLQIGGGSDPRPVDHEAAIRQLVDRYYGALRNGRYEEAATYYESTAFDGMGIDPPMALKQATELSGGIPPKIVVEALRIEGNRATCELLIEREGQGSVYYVAKDEKGNTLGTWARTLHFVREKGVWKIATSGDNAADADTQKALEMLRRIQAQQTQNKNNH